MIWSRAIQRGVKYVNTPKIGINKFAFSSIVADDIIKKNCIYLPKFFDDLTIFKKLEDELKNNNMVRCINHYKYENPSLSPTFNSIVDKLSKHFNLTVYSTRLNYYRDGNDCKPNHKYHPFEYFTVMASFGASRTLDFMHLDSELDFKFPQNNGDVFAFTSELNYNFRYGFYKTMLNDPQFSIIVRGNKK